MTAPPPNATTESLCNARGSTVFSKSRNVASPLVAKISAIDMQASCSTRWSRSKNFACTRSATSAPTRVLPDPMKPSSASGLREWLDAAWVGRHWSCRRRDRYPASAPLLGLDEDLVAEIAGLRQVVKDFGALGAGRVHFDATVSEDAADQRLPRRAVLHPVDRDDLFLAAEDARLDRDPLVAQRIGDRLPSDPDHDEPEQRERDHADRQEGAQLRHVKAVVGPEQREIGDDGDDEQDHWDDQALDDRDPVGMVLQDEVLAGKELAHGALLSLT